MFVSSTIVSLRVAISCFANRFVSFAKTPLWVTFKRDDTHYVELTVTYRYTRIWLWNNARAIAFHRKIHRFLGGFYFSENNFVFSRAHEKCANMVMSSVSYLISSGRIKFMVKREVLDFSVARRVSFVNDNKRNCMPQSQPYHILYPSIL